MAKRKKPNQLENAVKNATRQMKQQATTKQSTNTATGSGKTNNARSAAKRVANPTRKTTTTATSPQQRQATNQVAKTAEEMQNRLRRDRIARENNANTGGASKHQQPGKTAASTNHHKMSAGAQEIARNSTYSQAMASKGNRYLGALEDTAETLTYRGVQAAEKATGKDFSSKKLGETKAGAALFGKQAGSIDDFQKKLGERAAERQHRGQEQFERVQDQLGANDNTKRGKAIKAATEITDTITDIALDSMAGPASLGLMATRAYGNEKRSALDAGATRAQAEKSAIVTGATEVMSEKIFGANKIMKSIYGKGIADEAETILRRNLAKVMAKKTHKNLAEAIANGGMSILEEALEEGIAEGIEPRAANLIYGNALKEQGVQNASGSLNNLQQKYNLNPNTVNRINTLMANDANADAIVPYMQQLMAAGASEEEVKQILGQYLEAQSKVQKPEYLKSMLMGGAVGGILGGASVMMDYRNAQDINAQVDEAFGAGEEKRLISDVMRNAKDQATAARAQALAEEYDKTGTVSSYAVREMAQAQAEAQRNDYEKARSSFEAGMDIIQKKGLEAPIDSETAFYTNQEAKAKAQSVVSKMQLPEGESNAIATALGNFAAGQMTVEDMSVFVADNAEARAAFEEATGLSLAGTVKYNKAGEVDVAATNEATKDFIAGHATDNLVKVAEQHNARMMAQVKSQMSADVTRSMGAAGQAAYDQVADSIALENAPEGMPQIMQAQEANMLFKMYYQAGRNNSMSVDELDKALGERADMFSDELKTQAYEAGQEDKSSADANAQAKADNVAAAATAGTAREGKLSVELDSADGTAISESHYRMFRLLAQSLGININIRSNEFMKGQNGYYQNGEIYLNATQTRGGADRMLEYIFAHELTHHIKKFAPEQYNNLENLVRSNWEAYSAKAIAAGKIDPGMTTMATAVKRKQEQYKRAVGQELSEEDALEEIIADATYEMLNDKNFVKKACDQDIKLGEAILDAVRTMAARIRDVLTRGKGFVPSQNAGLLKQLDILEEFENLWLEGLAEARRNKAAVGFAADKTRYSVATTTTGEKVVVVNDKNVSQFDLSTNKKRKKALAEFKKIVGRYKRIPVNGQKFFVGRRTKTEPFNSKAAEKLAKKNPQKFSDKLDAFAHPFDILYASDNYIGEAPTHERRDNFVEFGRGDVLMQIHGRQYEAEVVVGITNMGAAELYDVVNIQETTFEIKKETPSSDYLQNARYGRDGSPLNKSITPTEAERKSSLPEIDARYEEAYFDDDEDAMREILDEAAARNGYNFRGYHHTENYFTEFDLGKARRNMDIQGFYFSADPEAEAEYGSMNYDTYLKMENPYVIDSKEKADAIPVKFGEEDYGVKVRDWLKENGYDSVIRDAEYYGAEADEYIVLDNTQIKSAELWTYEDEYAEEPILPSQRFDESNPDIRYSVSESFDQKYEEYGGENFKPQTEYSDGQVKYSVSTEYIPHTIGKISGDLSDVGGSIYVDVESELEQKEFTARELRNKWAERTGLKKKEIKALDKIMDNVANWLQGPAEKEYTYLGLRAATSATLEYRVDKDGNPTSVILSAMVKNGEYPINFDFTSVCKKRVAFQKLMSDIAKNNYDEVDLSPENIKKINDILEAHGFEVACPICFVEARRYNNQAYVDKIVNKWNETVLAKNPNAKKLNAAELTPEKLAEMQEQIDEAWAYYDVETKKLKDDALAKKKADPELKKRYEELKKIVDKEEATDEELEEFAELEGASWRVKVDKLTDSDVFQVLLSAEDLLTEEGTRGLKSIDRLFGLLKQSRGASAPKETTAFTAYNSEVAMLMETFHNKLSKAKKAAGETGADLLRKKLYEIGGVRMQSFSDFQIQHVYDYMQLIGDMAAGKLPAHAYSKELAFAELFGMTGMKINLSVVCDIDPNVDSAHAGLTKDENGNWVYNIGKQSIDYDKAVELQNRPGYTGNIGIIMVVMSDEHMKMALNDPNVRYIIPYHKSGLPVPVQKATSIDMARDFTNRQNSMRITSIKPAGDSKAKSLDVAKIMSEIREQYSDPSDAIKAFNDKIAAENLVVGTKSSGHGPETVGVDGKTSFDIYADLKKTNDPRQTAKNYIAWCMEANKLPICFEFADHPDYYKMLFDFNTIDNKSGKTVQQGPVQNIYPGVNAQKGESDITKLTEVIGRYMEEQNDINKVQDAKYQDVVSEVLQNVAMVADSIEENERGDEKKHSVKDQEYLDAVERGDMETAQKMVDEAAEEAGYYDIAYHGTYSSFTKFVENESNKGIHFFTDDPNVAHGYGRISENPMKVRLALGRSIFIDAQGAPWDDVFAETYDMDNVDDRVKSLGLDLGGNVTTDQIGQAAKANGFDSVVIENVTDPDAPATDFILFDSNSVKSADPVTYDDNGNVIPLSQRFNQENEDIRWSLSEGVGYHAGDLGKSEPLAEMGAYRDTGHFGTGTYFVGNPEQIKDHNSRDGKPAPMETIDVSGYNLFRPWDSERAYELHRFLRDVNTYYDYVDSPKAEFGYVRDIERKLDDLEYEIDEMDEDDENYWPTIDKLLRIAWNTIGVERLEKIIPSEDDDSILGYKDANEVTRRDISRVVHEIQYPDYWHDWRSEAEDVRNFFKSLDAKVIQLGVYNEGEAVKILRNIKNELEGVSYEESLTHDTASTMFMKALGYEGIDVRHTELDNTRYGSVIYDLKGEDLERKNEIGTARFSVSEEEYNQLVEERKTLKDPVSQEAAEDYMAENQDEYNELPVADQRVMESRGRREAIKEEALLLMDKLNRDTRLTHGEVLNKKSVSKQLREFVKEIMVNSDARNKNGRKIRYKQSAVEQLTDAAYVMWKQIQNDQLDEAVETAYDAALQVVDDLDLVIDDAWVHYKDVRDYLRNTAISIPEENRDNKKYNEWRKANMGRIKVTNDGRPIDEAYGKLSELWPELFSPEIINPEEQAERLSDALDEIKPYAYAYSSEEADMLAKDIATDFVTIVYAGEAWKSYADKSAERYAQKTAAMKTRHQEAMRKLRNDLNAKHKAAMAEAKKKTDDKALADKMNEGRREAERKRKDAEKRANKRDHRERMKSFGKIKKSYEWLASRLVSPTDEKHIPELLRQPLAEFLQQIDLQTERSKKLEEKYGQAAGTVKMHKLRSAIEDIAAQGDGIELDDGLMQTLKELADGIDGRAIDELTNEEIQKVDVLFRALKHSIQNYNTFFGLFQELTIHEAAQKCFGSWGKRIERKGPRSEYSGLLGMADRIINESQVTPRDFFEHIGGGVWDLYKGGLRKGLDTQIKDMDKLRDMFGNIFAQYGNKKKPGSTIESWIDSTNKRTFNLENGQTVTMTPAHIMSLYASMMREQAVGHILGGGITVTTIDPDFQTKNLLKQGANVAKKALGTRLQNNGASVHVSYSDCMNIINTLTEEQKAVANQLLGVLQTVSVWGNEASMAMYGYRKFTEANYFPIKSADNWLNSDYSDRQSVEKIKNFGFTKGTVVNANNPIVIDDIFSVVADHCNKMTLYHAYAPAIADMTRLLNYKTREEDGTPGPSVKSVLETAYGKQAMSYINKFMSDVQNQTAKRKGGFEHMFNKVLSNSKKAAIAGSLSVALQQPTAIVRAFAVMNPIDFRPTPGAAKRVPQNMREVKEHCPIALWKSWGFSQTDLAADMKDIMMNREWNKLDAITMELYGKLDDFTWSCIWDAVKNETRRLHKDVPEGSEEFWRICGERAAEVFDSTQVVDSPFHRSDVMRSQDMFIKTITSFMAEPTRTFNMIRSDVVKSIELNAEGKHAEAAATFGRMATVYVANAAAVSAAKAIADALRAAYTGDDKDDGPLWEIWLEKFYDNFKGNVNPLGLMPYFGQAFSDYGFSSMATEYIGDFISDSKKLFDLIKEGEVGGENWWKTMLQSIKDLSYVTGLPIKNVLREFEMASNMFGLQVFADSGEDTIEFADGSQMQIHGESWKDKLINHIPLVGKSGGDENYGETPTAEYDDSGLYDMHTSWFDDLIGRTAADKAEKQRDSYAKDALEAAKGKTGEDYYKSIYASVCSKDKVKDGVSLDIAIQNGDFRTVKQMRRIIERTGNQDALDYFDEQTLKKSKTAFKKTIGPIDSKSMAARGSIYQYLSDSGMSHRQIVQGLITGQGGGSKCDTAKAFQEAYALGEFDKAKDLCTQLRAAGIEYDDFVYLASNAYRVIKASDYATGEFEWPIDQSQARISSHVGHRSSPGGIGSTNHKGIDIAMAQGSEVRAADGGKVVYSGYNSARGKYIVVDHGNGTETLYQHLSWYEATKGQVVKKGQYIGNVGSTGHSTGPHLHLELHVNGQVVDPEAYLPSFGSM